MHIYNIFTFTLVIIQETEPNIFGRDWVWEEAGVSTLIMVKIKKVPKLYALIYVMKWKI